MMSEVSAEQVVRWRLLLGLVLAAGAMLVLPATSGASMPGNNGRIAFNMQVPKGEFDRELGVWSINPDGSGLIQLAGGEEDAYEGTYSPDGSRLVFGRYDELWTAAADGSGARVLSPGKDRESERTRWVHNYKDPETGQIVEWVKIDEEREERDAYSEPSFSADGKALAVVHYIGAFVLQHVCSTSGDGNQTCNGSYSEFEVVCDECGSSIDAIDSVTAAPLGTLVPRSTTSYISRPAYSSTGALVYEEIPNGEFEHRQIRLVPAPGVAPVVLASGEVGEPDFSPDGTRVAFASGRHELGVVATAGGQPSYVTPSKPEPDSVAYSVRSPIWSPDGATIAFGNLGAKPGEDRYTEGGVYLMHPDGSGIVRIQGDATVPTGWQPLPIPPSPTPSLSAVAARAVKGKKKIKLNKKGIAVVGKIVCGSSPCALKVGKSKLKVGKKRYGVEALFGNTLAAGATAPVKIKVKGKALAALKAKHHGLLALTLSVTDATGTQSLAFKPKVLPPPAKKHQKQKG
jgi:WD40-like Beta Propeller Repeat